MWHDIKHPKTGKLLFRFDPERDIIQIAVRGERFTIDLSELRNAGKDRLANRVSNRQVGGT